MLYLAVNACHHLVFAVFFCVEHDDTTVIMIMTEKNAWAMANSLFTVLLVCWGKSNGKSRWHSGGCGWIPGLGLRYHALIIMQLCIMNYTLCINNYAIMP